MRRIVSGLAVLAVGLVGSVAQAEVKQPQRIIDRPLTTPGGQLTVGGDLGFASIKILDERESSMGLGIPVFFGVDDKLEVNASYAFALKEFEAKGNLLVGAAYGILTSGKLLVAANAQLGYSIVGESIAPLNLGARIGFYPDKNLDIHSGGNQITVTLDGGDEIMGVSPPKPIFLSLPIGVGYQMGDTLYTFVDTSIGVIGLSDADGVDGFLFADFIPLKVGAFFSPSNTMDFGAAIDFIDLKEIGFDIVSVTLSARLHM